MTFPLNINLIIPFKDNKGERIKMYLSNIEVFKIQLFNRVEELKSELDSLFGDVFELSISARSDGSAKKFFWRFKSRKQDRTFNRLHAESVVEYLSNIHDDRKLRVKEMEVELIYINANLKVLKSLKDAVDQTKQDKKMLLQANI